MNYIKRLISESVKESFINTNKAIIIKGPRQSGKTTIAKEILKQIDKESLYLTGDDATHVSLLENISIIKWKEYLENKKYVFIDEAQKIKNIGTVSKLLTDNFDNIHLMMTGSSSFELANKTGEALTGRKREWFLLPLSFKELSQYNGLLEEKTSIETRVVYGSYPEVITSTNKREAIEEIAESYLLRDVLSIDGVRKASIFIKLLQALSYQVGSQVSFNELANIVGINKDTIAKYISILEQSYIIFTLHSFSTNLRTELKKSNKIYFYDCGIRNAILNDFSPFAARTPDEKGRLFENYLISERIKLNNNLHKKVQSYFWRTTQQAEIDYIEIYDSKISAFEFKLSPKKNNTKPPLSFISKYPNCNYKCITYDNVEEFLL